MTLSTTKFKACQSIKTYMNKSIQHDNTSQKDHECSPRKLKNFLVFFVHNLSAQISCSKGFCQQKRAQKKLLYWVKNDCIARHHSSPTDIVLHLTHPILPTYLTTWECRIFERPRIFYPCFYIFKHMLVETIFEFTLSYPHHDFCVIIFFVRWINVQTPQTHFFVQAHNRISKRGSPLKFLLMPAEGDEILFER